MDELDFDFDEETEKVPFHVRYRKALMIGTPVLLLALLFLTCRGGGTLERRSPIYKDFSSKYSVFLASEKEGFKQLDLNSGKLKQAEPSAAGLAAPPLVPKEMVHKSGIISGTANGRWSVIARPIKERGLFQFLMDGQQRKEIQFGTNEMWKKIFWSSDAKYMLFFERHQGGLFSMLGQVFDTGLIAEDDARPQMLVALELATLRTCNLAIFPNNHYIVIINPK